MSGILNEEQSQGLQIAIDRFRKGEPYTTIAGLPGTGKTFLAVEIVKSLGFSDKDYAVATFTGKAASVLQQRGLPATTLHKLLYKSVPVDNGETFIHIAKDRGEIKVRVLIIDEISMVPKNILVEAAKHNIHIIALGDPNQLPAIGEDNGLLAFPHIYLKQIMRQAEGNSIITFSRKLLEIKRYNDKIEWKNDDMVKVIDRADVVDGMFSWADQIICSKNASRKRINQMVRAYHGFSGDLPEDGEKIIFTKNSWDTMNQEDFPIVNGMTGELITSRTGLNFPFTDTISFDFQSDFTEAPFRRLHFSPKEFITGEKVKNPVMPKGIDLQEIDFGYCVTVHKSQGSEWGNLLVFEEAVRSDTDLKSLFTAATRAKLKLVVVRDPKKSFIKII